MYLRFGQEVQKVLRKNLVFLTKPLLLWILTMILVGCSVGLKKPQTDVPSVRESAQSTEPRWSAYYGDLLPVVALDELEMAIFNRVMDLSSQNCIHDSRLTLAARRHASMLAASKKPPEDADLSRLRFAIHQFGGTDYYVEPYVTRSNPGGLRSLYELVEKRKPNWSHCGVGVSEGKVVWIGVKRIIELRGLPSRVNTNMSLVLRGRVLVESVGPVHLFLGHPGGKVTRLPPARPGSDRWFQVLIPIVDKGRNEIELMVDTGRGLETVVLVPIFAGVSPNSSPVVVPDLDYEGGDLSPEEVLFEYLTVVRKRAGMRMLVRNSLLDTVAKEHSTDMVRQKFFGHVSPHNGALARRLFKRGLSPVLSAENVARSGSLARAHHNLMGSPSHRANTLGPDFTCVGIGVAKDGKDYIVTQIFAKF
jgi:uncharacterized protein YkwD